MLNIDKAIKINKYGQGLIVSTVLATDFSNLELTEKRNYLKEITSLIIQSKPSEEDIQPAILESKLKPTFTCCVFLTKGVSNHHLQKMTALPESELDRTLLLLLSLFKIAYQRRYKEEKNHPNKWWYWDLSDESNIDKIREDQL